MQCPKCGSSFTCVNDSRPTDGTVRRRRECADCHHKFTTYEVSHKQWIAINRIAEMMKEDETDGQPS